MLEQENYTYYISHATMNAMQEVTAFKNLKDALGGMVLGVRTEIKRIGSSTFTDRITS